jgi:tetrahedral aminopeptidase
MLDLFKRLAGIHGASGFEDEVMETMVEELERCRAHPSVDAMGNVIGRLGSGKRSLMVSVHMDEVGMLVKYIDEKGYLYFDLNGLVDERVLLSTQVDIRSAKGIHTGVVGVKSRHLLTPEDLNKPITLSDLWIDVGAENREQVRAWGIDIGDPIVFHPNALALSNGTVISKAVDNRAGCAILIDLAERMNTAEIDFSLFLVAATQEEIGSRGARVAAQTLGPDIAIVIDTCLAMDPITPPQQTPVECGKGPVIRAMDVNALGWGTIYSKKIRQRLISTAAAHAIPYQADVMKTWTDASTIHTSARGIPCGGVYVPRRYSHSPLELVKWGDVENTAALLFRFVQELSSEAIEELTRRG